MSLVACHPFTALHEPHPAHFRRHRCGRGRFDLRTAPDQIYFVEVSREVMEQIKALQGDAPLWVAPVRVKASVRKHDQAGPAGKYGAIAKVTELAASDDLTLCR